MAFSIGFSNFRQFKHFPAIPIGDITILVGANNAGKSTLVKALLLMEDYFSHGDYISSWHNARLQAKAEDAHDTTIYMSPTKGETPRFYFDRLYAAHVGTFRRAKCNKINSNTITFEYCDDVLRIEIVIEGDSNEENATSAPVCQIRILDLKYNVEYLCDYKERLITIIFHTEPLDDWEWEDDYKKAMKDIFGAGHTIHFEGDEQDQYFSSVPQNAIIRMPITFNALNRGGDYIGNFLGYITSKINATIGEGDFSKKSREQFTIPDLSNEFIAFLKRNNEIFDRLERHLMYLPISGGETEYIYAHAISQNVIFSTKDYSSDFVSKTIHEFAEPGIQANDAVRPFVQSWLRFFDIGYDYDIISIGGEAHVVNIKSEDGTYTNLADKGMGAIQLIVLIFRLAKKITSKLTDGESLRIVIEEPEQNLHPCYQSKLAEFFYIMNRDYHFRFLIETHSEYLIRKTQVLVKENHLAEEGKKNPFKVYYFGGDNADGKPYYQMKYQPDGRFANKFGKGFFDEATKLAYNLL